MIHSQLRSKKVSFAKLLSDLKKASQFVSKICLYLSMKTTAIVVDLILITSKMVAPDTGNAEVEAGDGLDVQHVVAERRAVDISSLDSLMLKFSARTKVR